MIRIHKMLCCADDYDAAQKHVRLFFEKSMLVTYDSVEVIRERSLVAVADTFWSELNSAIEQNRLVLNSYIQELKEAGCSSIDDCAALSNGYPSKLFHLIAHLLDGFIGIDSVFYCLPEDSHWLSASLKSAIESSPEKYWLIHAEGYFVSASKASLVHT
nr:hypothetical protein [Desulfobulbaceae bacterium]